MEIYRDESQKPKITRIWVSITSILYRMAGMFILIVIALLALTYYEDEVTNFQILQHPTVLKQHVVYLLFFYGLVYLGVTLGLGLLRQPGEILSQLTLLKCISNGYYSFGYCSTTKEKVYQEIEKIYSAVECFRDKFKTTAAASQELAVLSRIKRIVPVDVLIEIESSWRKTEDRHKKYHSLADYIKKRPQYTIEELEAYESVLLVQLRLYRRAKLNYYKSLVEVVYWEEIEKGVSIGSEFLSSHYTNYFARPVIFRALPELEMAWYSFLFPAVKLISLILTIIYVIVLFCSIVGLTIRSEFDFEFSPAFWIATFIPKSKLITQHVLLVICAIVIGMTFRIAMKGVNTFKIFRHEFYDGHTPEEAFVSSAFFVTKLSPPILLIAEYLLMDPGLNKPTVFSKVTST